MNAMFSHRFYVHPALSSVGFLLRLGEPLLVVLCAVAAYVARNGSVLAPLPYVGLTILVAVAYAVVAGFSGIYRPVMLRSFVMQLPRLAMVGLLTFATMVVTLFLFKVSSHFSRVWIVLWVLLVGVVIGSLRVWVTARYDHKIASGAISRRIAVLGTGNKAMVLMHHLREERQGFSLFGLFAVNDEEVSTDIRRTRLYRGDMEKLLAAGLAEQYDDLIVAVDMDAVADSKGLLDALHKLPVNVFYCLPMPLFDRGVGQLPGLGSLPLVPLFRRPLEGPGLMVKRVIDVVASGLGLVAISPVLLAVAAMVKLSSPGPVFFRQRRNGFGGQEFDMLKFRSMRVGEAPKDASGKEMQAIKADPRITAVGRFIRKTSLDELPQLINILRGDMSLVGPRPHAISHNSYYEGLVDRYASRHKMRPGLTGWAQLNGLRGETDTLEKMAKRVEFDIWYVENWSLALDLKILFLTPLVVVFQKSAY